MQSFFRIVVITLSTLLLAASQGDNDEELNIAPIGLVDTSNRPRVPTTRVALNRWFAREGYLEPYRIQEEFTYLIRNADHIEANPKFLGVDVSDDVSTKVRWQEYPDTAWKVTRMERTDDETDAPRYKLSAIATPTEDRPEFFQSLVDDKIEAYGQFLGAYVTREKEKFRYQTCLVSDFQEQAQTIFVYKDCSSPLPYGERLYIRLDDESDYWLSSANSDKSDVVEFKAGETNKIPFIFTRVGGPGISAKVLMTRESEGLVEKFKFQIRGTHFFPLETTIPGMAMSSTINIGFQSNRLRNPFGSP